MTSVYGPGYTPTTLPGSYSYSLYTGDTWSWLVTLHEADGTTPQDLTNFTVGGEFFIAFNPTMTDLTVANGRIVLVTPTAGVFLVRVEGALTATAPANRPGPYAPPFVSNTNTGTTRVQVYVTDQSGNRTTVGIFTVTPIQP